MCGLPNWYDDWRTSAPEDDYEWRASHQGYNDHDDADYDKEEY